MGAVKLNSSGSGSVTLDPGSTSGNYTLTLPNTASGTIASSAVNNNFAVDQTIHGLTVGLGNGSVSTNTAVGANALKSNTTGDGNTSIGYNSLYTNTTGYTNLAIGQEALYTNNGNSNCAVGGYRPLYANTSGAANSAFGDQALTANTTGSYNVGLGASALKSNTTATYNTAVGYQAGYSNTVGLGNTAIGYQALYNLNRTADTTSYNTAVGQSAGLALTTGQLNTFMGFGAGNAITTGSKNAILGSYSGNSGGLDIRAQNNRIVISDGDGNPRIFHDGNYVTFFNANSAGGYSQVNWSIDSVMKAAMWWDNSLLRLYTYTTSSGPYLANGGSSWTNSSDERLKNITGEIQDGLNKVCTLRAAEFTWKADEKAKPQVGLIAQDVLKVLPEAVEVPEEGAVEKDGTPASMGVNYTEVIPLLVAAIKELKAEIDELKAASK